MASFVTINLSPIVITCFVLLLKTGLSIIVQETNDSPATNNYAQRPLTSYESYLRDCSSDLYKTCGNDIYLSIFVGNQTTSDGCCFCFVYSVGKRCHEDITRYILASPDFRYTKILIWHRSKKVWDDCVSFLTSISPVESIDLP